MSPLPCPSTECHAPHPCFPPEPVRQPPGMVHASPHHPSPSKMFRTPSLDRVVSAASRQKVDRLLFVASFAKKRSGRSPSTLKRQTRTQEQNWFSGRIQENKEHAQNRRYASKARGGWGCFCKPCKYCKLASADHHTASVRNSPRSENPRAESENESPGGKPC